MKTKILQTVLIAITAVLFSSCTRNNGDIGELFGQWKVVSITANGENIPDYDGVMYFAFQSSVYCQKIVNEEAHWDDCVYAKWHYVESGIIIDFADPSGRGKKFCPKMSPENAFLRVGAYICGFKNTSI